MKTHTQYPYPITTVEQLRYVVENNLVINNYWTRDKIGSRKFNSITLYGFSSTKELIPITGSGSIHSHMNIKIVPKTVDELEVGDVVIFDDTIEKIEQINATQIVFVSGNRFYIDQEDYIPETFPHPLPIEIFPILDKE